MITLQETLALMSEAYKSGLDAHMRMMHPDADVLNKAQAKRYIKRLGFPSTILDAWERENLLTSKKNGEGKNSQILYSASEIDKLATSIKVYTLANRY